MHLDAYFFFFFNDTATTEIYTLSLHDALPIWYFSSARLRSDMSFKACTVPSWRPRDRKSTRLNSSHTVISYAVFCLKKKRCERGGGSRPDTDAMARDYSSAASQQPRLHHMSER